MLEILNNIKNKVLLSTPTYNLLINSVAMRSGSTNAPLHPLTLLNHHPIQILPSQRSQQQSSVLSINKNHFQITKTTTFHHSGPQLETQHQLKLNLQRQKKMTALFEVQKLSRYEYKQSTQDRSDSSLGYIAQINALERKKRTRAYFFKKNHSFEQSYKIGVLTKRGIEQDDKDKKQIQIAPSRVGQKQGGQYVAVEEMHYEMVLLHQKNKKMTKN